VFWKSKDHSVRFTLTLRNTGRLLLCFMPAPDSRMIRPAVIIIGTVYVAVPSLFVFDIIDTPIWIAYAIFF